MRLALAFVLVVVGLSPAFAQAPYVGVSLAGNIVRTSNPGPLLGSDSFGDGESLGVGVRAGTAIGERWGLDAEVVYPGEIEWAIDPPRFDLSGLSPTSPALSIIAPRQQYRTRYSTFSTTVWVKQSPADRLDLVYLGGIAFIRSEQAYRIEYDTPLPIQVPRFEQTSYYAGPVLGLDAPLRLTDHLRAVPGMRLMIFRDLLVMRPSIGVTWQF